MNPLNWIRSVLGTAAFLIELRERYKINRQALEGAVERIEKSVNLNIIAGSEEAVECLSACLKADFVASTLALEEEEIGRCLTLLCLIMGSRPEGITEQTALGTIMSQLSQLKADIECRSTAKDYQYLSLISETMDEFRLQAMVAAIRSTGRRLKTAKGREYRVLVRLMERHLLGYIHLLKITDLPEVMVAGYYTGAMDWGERLEDQREAMLELIEGLQFQLQFNGEFDYLFAGR